MLTAGEKRWQTSHKFGLKFSLGSFAVGYSVHKTSINNYLDGGDLLSNSESRY